MRECPFCGSTEELISEHAPYCYLYILFQNRLYRNYTSEEMKKAWNDRYERKCKMIPDKDYDFVTCTACGYEEERNLLYSVDGLQEFDGNYCPKCGCKVVN